MEAIKSNFSSGWDKNRTKSTFQGSSKKSTEKVDWKICRSEEDVRPERTESDGTLIQRKSKGNEIHFWYV